MASCDHLAWLRHVQNDKTGEIVIENTGRLGRIIKELPRQSIQTPQLILFIGTSTKDAALRQIFSQNNMGRRGEKGNINLRLETVSRNTDNPLLFAESSPFIKNPRERSHVLCHETVSYSAAWKPGAYSILDILYSRLFFLFSDLVCVFADDFSSQAAAAARIMLWAEIGSAMSLPQEMLPRLLVVASENSQDDTLTKALQLGAAKLSRCFSAAKLFKLAGDYLSPLARYQRLRDEVYRQKKEMYYARVQNHLLFSATHLAALFSAAVQHTARTITQEFNFIMATRAHNPLGSDYLQHLESFISQAAVYKPSHSAVASFIASSIIMDAYPPRMHKFSTAAVFTSLYKPYCYAAFESIYNKPCARYLCNEIEHYCSDLFERLQGGYISSSRLHWGNIISLDRSIALFRSNITCFYCIRRLPERHLTCGHSVCDECVRIFGAAVPGREDRLHLRCIYNDGGELVADIKPRTAGVRTISVDGGGSRGVTPLEYMKELQKLLQDCPLHENIDLASGSSSGGLCVLAKFHLKWPTERCANMFESFAIRCFGGSKSLVNFIKSALNYIVTDAIYDEATIEELLQEAYGANNFLFGHVPGTVSGTRVAVTAMTHGSQRTIFTNYNGSADILRDGTEPPSKYSQAAYVAIRPKHMKEEPLLWQVARATSAAPIFFRPVKMDTGDYWDGALGFSNPTELAHWEASRIWPGTTVDVAISLGTGEEPKRPISTSSRTRLLDTFNLLTDGEFHFRNMKSGSNPDHSMIRLNTRLAHATRLDSTDNLQLQRDNIYRDPKNRRDLIESAAALLVSNFYFELDHPLLYDLGVYYCQGSIHCRNNHRNVSSALEPLLQSPDIEFITETEVLSTSQLHQDICNVCHRYCKKVNFTVRHPTDLVTISLRASNGAAWRISGFPQTMAGFQEIQGFNSHFGTPDHDSPGFIRCLACDDGSAQRIEKRKMSTLLSGSVAKRMRN